MGPSHLFARMDEYLADDNIQIIVERKLRPAIQACVDIASYPILSSPFFCGIPCARRIPWQPSEQLPGLGPTSRSGKPAEGRA